MRDYSAFIARRGASQRPEGIESTVLNPAGRRFIGVELKRSYYEQAARNLMSVDAGPAQASLFG